jgi:flavin reductase (DIM6/NTAB) family NADH-FMN oxidoreductase RutF
MHWLGWKDSRILILLLAWFIATSHCLALALSVLESTAAPPLLDVPVYSMATSADGATTNMNLVTYATPISIRPDRLWALGIYKETLTYETFSQTKTCVLQLLPERLIPIVRILGGMSGRTVNKQTLCQEQGIGWIRNTASAAQPDAVRNSPIPWLLPDCISYVTLRAIDIIENPSGNEATPSSHAIAICQVEAMHECPKLTVVGSVDRKQLSTGKLRELGIITEQGRIADSD